MIFWRKLYYKIIFKYIDEKHNLRKCAIFGIFIFLIIIFTGNENMEGKMNLENYEKYLKTWLAGLGNEINFWNSYMKDEGDIYFYGFRTTISPERPFDLEKDIPVDMYGKEYKFIDVGSGPFSKCGKITDKVLLNAISVDPLAYAYRILKDKYNVENGIRLESGFVELLDKIFEPNTFDMVHMSNSLDHSFSAVDGIYQLLNICKIGGKVILRHAENEAERASYGGLHQWNLSLYNKENSFVIWRQNERYDICKIFQEYADFELIPSVIDEDEQWIYNKVVMTKKKNIEIPINSYYDIMLNLIYKELISKLVCVESFINTINEKSLSISEKRMKKIRMIWHQKEIVKQKFKSKNWKTFIIYGMGYVGKNLDYLLTECGIDAVKLDQKGKESACPSAITMEQCSSFDVDVIIVSIDNEEVFKRLGTHIQGETKLLGIDQFLEIIEI